LVLPKACGELGTLGFVRRRRGGHALGVADAIGIGGALALVVGGVPCLLRGRRAGGARSVDRAQVPADQQCAEHTGERQPHGRGDEAEQELHGSAFDTSLAGPDSMPSPIAVTVK
jgi:hypothetical protein